MSTLQRYKETCHESALLDVVMRVLFRAINIICFDRNTALKPESKYPHIIGNRTCI